jgi:hypothetical protein
MFYGCAFRKSALKLKFEQGRHLKKNESLTSVKVLIFLKAQSINTDFLLLNKF